MGRELELARGRVVLVVLVLLARVEKLRTAQRDECAMRGRRVEEVVVKERTVVDSIEDGEGELRPPWSYIAVVDLEALLGSWRGCGALLLWAALRG